MKHLCYILLLIVVSSNCLKVNLKSPLMPNYNENLASYAESFFSSKHNVFKNNHNGYNNYPSISEEKIDQNSRRINLNFDDIERLETEKIGNYLLMKTKTLLI